MKRVLALFAALGILLALSAAACAGPQDFILVNNTGYPIYYVNVSPSNSNNWEEDIMGSDILPNGAAVRINFNVGNQQYWDIQAIFEDESSIAWYEIDLLQASKVTLNGDGTASLE